MTNPPTRICPGGKVCAFRVTSAPGGLLTWTCENCQRTEQTAEGEMLPYFITMANHYFEMVAHQCESCAEYQESRPTCRIVQGYFKGEFFLSRPAAWFYDLEGRPFCQKRKAALETGAPLAVLQDPRKTPQAPAEILQPFRFYHAESETLGAVDTQEQLDKCLAQGCDEPHETQVQDILLGTIYCRGAE